MPNHTATILSVIGPQADFDRLIVDASKSGKLGFNSLFPTPPELKEVGSPVTIVSEEEAIKDRLRYDLEKSNLKKDEWLTQLKISQKQSDSLVALYGHNNWYDWNVANWSTKWEIYDLQELGNREFSFNTAWSPATNLWVKVSKSYPDLTFIHRFADEGGGFVGMESIKNGKIIESANYDWDSEEGVDLRTELGYGDVEDEEGEE